MQGYPGYHNLNNFAVPGVGLPGLYPEVVGGPDSRVPGDPSWPSDYWARLAASLRKDATSRQSRGTEE